MDTHLDIAQVLADAAKAKARRPASADSFGKAIDAAVECDGEQRAWRLVVLASALREESRAERALEVLDAAVALRPPRAAQRAAFTCAAAIHADNGDLDTARKLVEELLAEGTDDHVLKIAARTYWELYEATKEEAFFERWKHVGALLEESPASA